MKRDTSKHWIECPCADCQTNGTGLWATLEVLRRHKTRRITDGINREILALISRRGSVEGVRDAA